MKKRSRNRNSESLPPIVTYYKKQRDELIKTQTAYLETGDSTPSTNYDITLPPIFDHRTRKNVTLADYQSRKYNVSPMSHSKYNMSRINSRKTTGGSRGGLSACSSHKKLGEIVLDKITSVKDNEVQQKKKEYRENLNIMYRSRKLNQNNRWKNFRIRRQQVIDNFLKMKKRQLALSIIVKSIFVH